MTKAAKRELKSVGVPSVRLHTNVQYYTRIGDRESASGKRERAYFYLGKNEKAAVARAAALKHEWREIKRSGGPQAVWPLGNAIAPTASLARKSPAQINAAVERYHADMTAHALE